jgi:hypothetical protein
MPREQLRLLADDVARLLVAGSRAVVDDPALRQRGQALRALAAKVPALGAVADAIDQAAEPSAFLELLVMVRQARAGLSGAGAAGLIESVGRAGTWTTTTPAGELLGLRDALRQSDWYEAVKEAAERGTLADLRLLDLLLDWLGGLPDWRRHTAAQDHLGPLAAALIPELVRRFDARGGAADVARLIESLNQAVAKAEQVGLTKAAVDQVGRRTRALAKRGEPDGVAAVVAQLEHPMNLPGDGGHITVSLNWIDKNAAGAVPPLLAGLKCRAKFLRRRVVEALGKLSDAAPEAVVPALIRVLREEESDSARAAAAQALKACGATGEQVVGGLVALLGGANDPRSRKIAAEALGVCGRGSPQAVTALEAALVDKVTWVGPAAQTALDALGGQRG